MEDYFEVEVVFMKDLAIYVHIPFCRQKCKYCDFNSYAGKQEYIQEYIEALTEEILRQAKKTKDYVVKSVYFGGGTPSFISSEEIEKVVSMLRENYCFSDDLEMTIEANPGTVNAEKLAKYREIGFNRLSFGVQAVQDEILREIGRIHTFDDVVLGYYAARKVGFANISFDLMFGLPKQHLKDVEMSVDKFIELGPEHISAYSLKVEENTVFGKMEREKRLILPSEDEEREMYYLIKERLKKARYEQYEISNFAKPGQASRHNLAYWKRCDYIGFGAGAASCFEEMRFSNIEELEEYINRIRKNESVRVEEERLTEDVIHSEEIILGLRLKSGVRRDLFCSQKDTAALKKLIEAGLLRENDSVILLTDKGLDLANQVFVEFI